MKTIVKNFIKIFINIILLIIILFNLTGCYDAKGIEQFAYVVAIGLDITDKNQLELTMQFASVADGTSESSPGSSQSNKSTLTSVECNSIDSGISLINSHISKKVNLSHCQEIIVSEKLAYLGLSEYLDTFANNIELRNDCNIVISKNNAKEYLEKVKPSLETLTARYYESSLNSSQYTGYTVKVNLSEFYSDMKSTYSQSYAILGGINPESSKKYSSDNSSNKSSSGDSSSGSSSSDGSSSDSSSSDSSSSDSSSSDGSSSEKPSEESLDNPSNNNSSTEINANYTAGQHPVEDEDAIETLGIAVFNGDKLVGELTGLDSICHVIVNNELDRCTLSIPSPFESEKYVDIALTSSKSPKCSVDFKDSSPIINIDVYLIAYGLSLNEKITYDTEEALESIQNSAETYIKDQIEHYLYKTSKEFNSDISGFGKYAMKNYLTIDEWNKSNWLENYKNSSFNVNVDLTMKSGNMFSNS